MNRLIFKRYSFRKLNIILLSVVIVFTLFISIGYSAINSNLLISGDLIAKYNERGLYEKVRSDAYNNNFAKKYEGDISTFKGDREIYYYYGEATNNNVRFADFCWKVVRTTDTGGVKLLYNGVPAADGSCNNTGEASSLTKEQMNTSGATVSFNEMSQSLADVGYMYNTRYVSNSKDVSSSNFRYGNSFTWDGTNYTLTDTVDSVGLPSSINTHHYTCFNTSGVCNKLNYIYYKNNSASYYIILSEGNSVEDALNEMLYNDDVNTNNSIIKEAIDYWYSNNMIEYTAYLEDAVWCNDRSMSNKESNGWNPNGGSASTYLNFKSYSDRTNLTCRNKNDRFTVDKANGNGALTYPVGMIDATELVLAYIDSSPYASGNSYWGFSPVIFYISNAYGYAVNSAGFVSSNDLGHAFGARPAVSLKAGTEFLAGDGSGQKPYVIETTKPNLYERVKLDYNNPTRYIKKYEGDISTFKGDKEIYYYYGEATNNNVMFAEYCWKIVRTTDTGGVKLLYNGVAAADGSCNNTGEGSLLTKEQMNTSSDMVVYNVLGNSIADVGYMFNRRLEFNYRGMNNTETIKYGNSFKWDGKNYTLIDTKYASNYFDEADISNYHYTCFTSGDVCEKINYLYYVRPKDNNAFYLVLENGENIESALNDMLFSTEVNKDDSIIKRAIDYWYENNMLEYTSYLEDTVWCNDRSFDSRVNNFWNPNGGNDVAFFNSNNNITDLTCKNKMDSFTVEAASGNGALKYPVGLITRQEQNLAYINARSPLASDIWYWGLSPYYYHTGIAYNFYVLPTGNWEYKYTITNGGGVRPMISLKYGIDYLSGDGSSVKPYVIAAD